jgi:hypothetical protein
VGTFPGIKRPGRNHSTPPPPILSRCENGGQIYIYFHVRTRAVCSAATHYTLQVAKCR